MRFHVPALPFTQLTREYDDCGHTQKVRRFATTMWKRGHEVFLYAGDDSEAVTCTELVHTYTRADQERWADGVAEEPAKKWEAATEWWSKTNLITAGEIVRRAEPGDFVCVIGGTAQLPLANYLPAGLAVCEYSVGYYGTFAPFRAYESHAHRAFCHGLHQDHGRWFDEVIPGMFDPEDYGLCEQKQDFLLYLGRVMADKGITIAEEVARATGRPLLIAGEGDRSLAPSAHYLGRVSWDVKRVLLAAAHAVLMPTLYMEPFGNVAIEAMLSGTPCFTPDWGAFTETVPAPMRCRTLREFVTGVEEAGRWEPAKTRAGAAALYSTTVVGEQYERWFERIQTVQSGAGWYEGVTQHARTADSE